MVASRYVLIVGIVFVTAFFFTTVSLFMQNTAHAESPGGFDGGGGDGGGSGGEGCGTGDSGDGGSCGP